MAHGDVIDLRHLLAQYSIINPEVHTRPVLGLNFEGDVRGSRVGECMYDTLLDARVYGPISLLGQTRNAVQQDNGQYR